MEREVERRLESEAEYENALDEIECFFDKEPKPGTPDVARFDMLARAIEDYENEHWPLSERPRRSRASGRVA